MEHPVTFEIDLDQNPKMNSVSYCINDPMPISNRFGSNTFFSQN